MSTNLQNCLKEFSEISRLRSPSLKRAKLKSLKNKGCIFLALKEIALNIWNKNIPIPTSKRKELLKYVKLIKAILKAKSRKTKEELVIQAGGFITAILPILGTVLPIVSSLLMNATS